MILKEVVMYGKLDEKLTGESSVVDIDDSDWRASRLDFIPSSIS